MTLDYFYGQTGELFSFYRIPKALFQEQRFQSLSTDAKTLYGILLDRMSLSAKNGWLDEQNRVFIIFTIEDVKRSLCCADNKATKLLRELEEFGLIERKRRGLGRPSLVYVKNFSADSSKTRFQNRENHEFPQAGFSSTDYFPLLPWIFLFATGYFLYSFLQEKGLINRLFGKWKVPGINFLGKHSLIIYMIHQPICYVVAFLVSEIF